MEGLLNSKSANLGSIFMARKKDNNVKEINNMNENEIIDYSYLQTVQEINFF